MKEDCLLSSVLSEYFGEKEGREMGEREGGGVVSPGDFTLRERGRNSTLVIRQISQFISIIYGEDCT